MILFTRFSHLFTPSQPPRGGGWRSALALWCLLLAVLPLVSARAQTKYTADFSTSPSFDYEGGQTSYKTRTTVSIGGVNYLIHNAINADFTWTGSAVSYNPYSGVGLLIEREDQQPFAFYGVDLNYTSVNTDLAHAPWLVVSYQGANGAAAPSDSYNETSKNFSVSKPSGVTVKYVQLYFADLATLVLDNLIVGPATTTSPCTSPTIPTISSTRTAICAGSSTILSVQSGSLNDATNWKWYSGSCGGTLVGTGSAIQVSPGSTTTYYVRGEGGCVTPGSCASQQITVSAPFFASLTNNGPLTCAKTSVTLTTTGGPTGATYAYTGGAQVTSANQATATVSQDGIYQVTVTAPGGCSATATTVVSSNTLAPSVGVSPTDQTICQGQTAVFTAQGASTYTWSTGATTAAISANASGTYSVTGVASNGCRATASARLTVNPLPTVSIVPSALTGCAGTIITLSAQGADRYVWNTGATTTSIPVTATGTGVYSVTGTITSTGCSATASQSITIYPLPPTPTLLTKQGQSYPGGQSSVTVDLNSPSVVLEVGGCNGTISWSGSNGSAGNTNIIVPTDRVGRVVYTARCISAQGCVSEPASATVIVQGRLTVLHRDVDNYADNNAIQPLLVLQNQGGTALPLSRLTLRYYLTVEGNSPLSNLNVNYAQVGNGNVRLRYVPLNPAQQGASGYVEVSFTAGAGSLAAGGNTGPIQAYFAKSDYSSLFEPDDYSYNPLRDQLTATLRVTAYYDGVLTAGIEPGSNNATIRAVRALTESRNGPSATQINTVLEVRNEGTVAINYSDLSARYYFTSDGSERLQVEVDEGNVSTRLVALPQPVAGANYYLEIRYNQGGQLAPGASTGAIRYRISKPDGGRFDQTNDYSYQEQPAERSQNSRVVVYVGQELIWGISPSGSARIASPELGAQLEVVLLGNPVRDVVSVQIKGAGAEPLQLQLVSAQGRLITTRQVATPHTLELQELSVADQEPGVLLLQVSTPTQSRTIRVLKAE